jgi:dienelactone hydrolase
VRLSGRWLPVLTGVALLAGCGGSHVHIAVDRPVALWDAPLRISVSGLKHGEHTVLRATTGDWLGRRFGSSTPVTADSAGRIELSGDSAVQPLWSLRPLKPAGGGQTSPSGLTVTLSIGGARATIHRLLVAPGVHGVAIRHPFYGEYYAPAKTSARRPGILVFGGSEGGLSTIPIAQLYASHGYPTLALAYFGEPRLPHNLFRVPLEYFARAVRWLGQQRGVDSAKLVVEGISRGSEAAQLVGIHYPRLVHAVIAMVPSNGSYCGMTRFTANGGGQCIGAAWTFRSKAIPYLPFPSPATPYPFPDERIDGPIFLDCGGADMLWPSCPMAKAIVHRLDAHHFRHKITFLDFPQAGHGVGALDPNEPSPDTVVSGEHPYSNDRASATGWPRLLDFLDTVAHG